MLHQRGYVRSCDPRSKNSEHSAPIICLKEGELISYSLWKENTLNKTIISNYTQPQLVCLQLDFSKIFKGYRNEIFWKKDLLLEQLLFNAFFFLSVLVMHPRFTLLYFAFLNDLSFISLSRPNNFSCVIYKNIDIFIAMQYSQC